MKRNFHLVACPIFYPKSISTQVHGANGKLQNLRELACTNLSGLNYCGSKDEIKNSICMTTTFKEKLVTSVKLLRKLT